MKTKLLTFAAAALAVFGFAAGSLTLSASTATPAYAESICDIDGVSPEVKAAAGCPDHTTGTLNSSLQVILNGIIGFLGIVAAIVIVIGGVMYMTSTGDPQKTKRARDTILYAAIGLVVAALAAIIVNATIAIVNNASGSASDDGSSTGVSLVL